MNTLLKTVAFLLLFNLPVLAENQSDLSSREVLHSIVLNNRTNENIAYMFQTIYQDGFYGIKAGRSDVYHTGKGDGFSTILLAVCNSMTYNGGACKIINGETLKNCVGGTYYNAKLIKEVNINSLNSCSVTCVDGGSSSCKAK